MTSSRLLVAAVLLAMLGLSAVTPDPARATPSRPDVVVPADGVDVVVPGDEPERVSRPPTPSTRVRPVPGSRSGTVTTSTAAAVQETDFAADPTLFATPGQTIVMDLEDRASAGRFPHRRNTVRYLVEHRSMHQFCLTDSESPVLRLQLRQLSDDNRPGRIVARHRPGRGCDPAMLRPGRYQLEVVHDARRVPAGGRPLFLHQPERPRAFGTSQPLADFIVFEGPGGPTDTGFVTDNTIAPEQFLGAGATTVTPDEVWRVYANTDASVRLQKATDPVEGDVKVYDPNFNPPTPKNVYTGESFFPGALGAAPFVFTDAGPGGYFTVTLDDQGDQGDQLGPWHASLGIDLQDPDRLLTMDNANNTYRLTYKGFDAGSTFSLGPGEIALYAECNYQGPAIVFQGSTMDLDLYDAAAALGLGIGANMAASVKVGPDTFVDLYTEPNLQGARETFASEWACFDGTVLGNGTVSSLSTGTGVTEYVVNSAGCSDCILFGVDLNDQDLSNMDFSGTVFDGANLGGANMQGANLAGANFTSSSAWPTILTDTDLSGARLECTKFVQTDLRSTTLMHYDLVLQPTCRTDLTRAALDYSTFSANDWRHLDLSYSTMENVPRELSTSQKPLDLEGADLSGTTWLAGTQLDHATFCPSSSTAPTAALQHISLNGTSLVGACLREAGLQGANMDNANLDGADLQDAQLLALEGSNQDAASLEGAFLRNATLDGADLTSVSLDNANFFSCAEQTASATGATMTGATFTGAYLAGASFDEATLVGTEWTRAVLAGASFANADLGRNVPAGNKRTNFSGAFLQGTDFTNAMVGGANFNNSYWDPQGDHRGLNTRLPLENREFAGYWDPPDAQSCVTANYPYGSASASQPPVTDDTNTCPNGADGSCDGLWDQPTTPISQADPPTAFNTTIPPPCTGIDFTWTTPPA